MPAQLVESGPFAGLPVFGSDPDSPKKPRPEKSLFTGPPKGGPSAAHKAKARELAESANPPDPDDIGNERVREAYIDHLSEQEFGKPDRKETPQAHAARQHQEAIDAGEIPGDDEAGDDDPTTPGRAAARGNAGGAAAGTRPPSRPSGSSVSLPSWAGGSDGTGFLFGFLLYALGLNYLRYGTAGITGWLSAKFLNKPNPALTGGALTRTTPAQPTPIQLVTQVSNLPGGSTYASQVP